MDFEWATGSEIARAVRAGEVLAADVVEASLARIAARDSTLNSFTQVVAERARAKAAAIDAARIAGEPLGALAGVPFAVKNLFDIARVVTAAGSKINLANQPAARDAMLVERLEAAGAILVGALNMGEYAYDFTGENAHFGPSRNPHDTTRMTGGSSGGSGGAVAGGLVPLSLGSDTNGSIRVPSAFCGLFGLKPTYGRLSRSGTYPFVASLDHLGPIARSVADLALAYDAMQYADPRDPAQARRPVDLMTGKLEGGIAGLRIVQAGGYFERGCAAGISAAVAAVASALGVTSIIELPEVARARAAAFVITATEGAALHLDRLKTHVEDFDPDVRDRLIAGAMVPATHVIQAQKFRRWFAARMQDLFRDVDVIIAPATPITAPSLGQKTIEIEGAVLPLRPNIGLYTQPISFVGLPVVVVPMQAGEMPCGVQIITAPWREDLALRVAHHLETTGCVRAPRPQLMAAGHT